MNAFGKLLSAPTTTSDVELTNEQIDNFYQAIELLLSYPQRSEAEEMVLGVLQTFLSERLPAKTQLLSNYPNPFNPETWISYELGQETEVQIQIYNTNGQLVRQLDIGLQGPGRYVNRQKAAYWDGRTEQGERVASGIYFYQLQAGDYMAIKRMVILK